MYVPAAWSTLGVPAIRGRDMPWLRIPRLPTLATVVNSLIVGWLALSFLLTLVQTFRIVRFRRRLRAATPAPDKLLDEARWIGRRLGVSVPELLVIPEIGCPLLWCLGRPQLLLPARLVKTLPLDRWRGILTHELAHLRRGDHWVSRLELAAGLIWWWNPLYWLTRARLDAEAELACDAWVVWALPKDRLVMPRSSLTSCDFFPGQAAGTHVGCRRLRPIFREEIDHDLARRRPLPSLAGRPSGSLSSSLVRLAIVVGHANRQLPPITTTAIILHGRSRLSHRTPRRIRRR